MIKGFAGLILILIGLEMYLYVGIEMCLIGGITDIVCQIKAPVADIYAITGGVIKLILWMYSGFVFAVFFISGMALLQNFKKN